jgi:GNAT superfamily N-acetyltransferase
MNIKIKDSKNIKADEVIALYRANQWSSADKPEQLLKALRHSHTLITVRDDGKLIGLANAISDGYLMVYYPHMLVLPEYQGQGIGHLIMEKMQEKYRDFHMQMLTADGKAIEFYEKVGFQKAGLTQAMWIYAGDEH